MKKRGSVFEYGEQRDRELMAAFMRLLGELRGVPLGEIYGRAAEEPCSRFWVSEERALEVVSGYRRGIEPERMLPMKRKMYGEIIRRVDDLMESLPDLSLREAVERVVDEPAPEFYLTPLSARVIICRIGRRRRNARRLMEKLEL